MVLYYLMPPVFLAGILAIALEDIIRINKAATAVGMCIILWFLFLLDAVPIYTSHPPELLGDFFNGFPDFARLSVKDQAYKFIEFRITNSLGDVSATLFFVLGSMVIIEVISSFGGFSLITKMIRTCSGKKLLWIVSFLTFFLSALIGDLAAVIVMVAIARKLIPGKTDRLVYSCMIIISANAGGCWSPIGDVTTLLLWTGGNLSVLHQIVHVFPAGLVMMIVPLAVISSKLTKEDKRVTGCNKNDIRNREEQSDGVSGSVFRIQETDEEKVYGKIAFRLRVAVLVTGLLSLLLVPLLQTIFRLPAFMDVLLGLVILWIMTDRRYAKSADPDLQNLRVGRAFSRVDVSTIFFFLGILMSVQALSASGQLSLMAEFLNKTLRNPSLISFVLGICSSFLDNVALVSASMGMYPLGQMGAFMPNGVFWTFLAYCAVTGGSILIIGSASGVTVMGMEKISFGYYLKRFTGWVLLGYAAGAGIFLLLI